MVKLILRSLNGPFAAYHIGSINLLKMALGNRPFRVTIGWLLVAPKYTALALNRSLLSTAARNLSIVRYGVKPKGTNDHANQPTASG